MTTPLSRQLSRHAFTLIELLVVMGVIVVLVSILIPVVSKVKTAAQLADTKQVMSQLTNAINQYYADFHAYPGPFRNSGLKTPFVNQTGMSPDNTDIDYVVNGTGLIQGIPLDTYTYTYNAATSTYTGAWANSPTVYHVTGSENLVLSLLGGLNYDSTGQLGFNPGEVGLGPLNLNIDPTTHKLVSPQRSSPYIQSTAGANSGLLMWCGSAILGSGPIRSPQFQTSMNLQAFFDEANNSATDSPIPEFMDRFAAPLPILYLRARVGAQGVISDTRTVDTATPPNPLFYQYDYHEIQAYTAANPTSGASIGLGPNRHNLIPNNVNPGGGLDILYPPVATPQLPPSSMIPKAGVYGPQDGLRGLPLHPADTACLGGYFNNLSVTTSIPASPVFPGNNDNMDYYGTPRVKDQFILISAGPDGIYGTGDDITSFGDVMP